MRTLLPSRRIERKTAAPAPVGRASDARPTHDRKQRVVVPFEIKATDEAKRTFEGYSATWDLDLGYDVIHRGAFARTLEHFARGTKTIPLIDSHDYGSIFAGIGKLVDAKEDDTGLWSKWQLIGGNDGDRVLDRLRGGVIRKMSIGYMAVRYDYGKRQVDGMEIPIRNLYELKWEETSLVLFPMNEAADVDLTSVKSVDQLVEALRAGATLTAEQKQQLSALLDIAPAPATAPADQGEAKGLAPDDPQRLAMEATVRDITLRSLGTS